MHDGVVADVHAGTHRLLVGELERHPVYRFALLDGKVAAAGAPRRVLGRPGRTVHLTPIGEQAAHQPATHEPVGSRDEDLHCTRSRSASTMIRTSSAKVTRGAHSSSSRALDASACSRSTSAGRTNRGSTLTYVLQ